MKRYLVFEYDRYYAQGGTDDFLGSYDNLNDAESKAKENLDKYGMTEVWDITLGDNQQPVSRYFGQELAIELAAIEEWDWKDFAKFSGMDMEEL